MHGKTPGLFVARSSRPGSLALAVVAPLLLGMLAVGCASHPTATDVELTYCRKQTTYQPAVTETAFNETNTRWIKYRGDQRATMPVPGHDGGATPLEEYPLDLVIPERMQGQIEYHEEQKVLTWEGKMTMDDYSELRALSTDRNWQQAIAALYRGHAEVDAVREDRGYDIDKLPPGVFPAEDEMMRAVPAAFQDLDFFRYGSRARNEQHALGWFDNQPQVSECLVLTVDGVTTILPIPNQQDFATSNQSMQEFKRRLDRYRKCQASFAQIASYFRPARVVSNGNGRAAFSTEQDRLRRQSEEERRVAEAHNRDHNFTPEANGGQ